MQNALRSSSITAKERETKEMRRRKKEAEHERGLLNGHILKLGVVVHSCTKDAKTLQV